MSKVLVAVIHGDEVHTLEMPFCPSSGMVLLMPPESGKAQKKFKISDVKYDCGLGEVIVEGEFLPD